MRMAMLAAVLLAGGVASAQTVVKEADRTVYRDVTNLRVGPGEVDGTAERGAGSFLTARREVRFDSLLKVRTSFQPELEASVSDL